jgi:hypothetical protein
MNRTATFLVSGWSVLLAVLLGGPDQIWLTGIHAMWVASVVVVAIGTSAVVWVASPSWVRSRQP